MTEKKEADIIQIVEMKGNLILGKKGREQLAKAAKKKNKKLKIKDKESFLHGVEFAIESFRMLAEEDEHPVWEEIFPERIFTCCFKSHVAEGMATYLHKTLFISEKYNWQDYKFEFEEAKK